MSAKRTVEVFSAGCPVCKQALELVERVACDSCEVSVLDMFDADVAKRAQSIGIKSIPAVVIEGKIISCCEGRGPDETSLRAAGLGRPLD
jgi:thioredoxin-like negative regulator of GroEL